MSHDDIGWEEVAARARADFEALDDAARAGFRKDERPREKQRHKRARNGNGLDGLAPRGSPGPRSSGLPAIVVNNRPMREVTAEALAALLHRNEPPRLFLRLGEVCRIRLDGQNQAVIEVLDEAALRGELDRSADCFRRGRDGILIPIAPPSHVVRDLAKLPELSFPPIEAVVPTPVLRGDGTVLNRPGYDPKTRLFYHPRPGLSVPTVPTVPTDEDRACARSLVEEVICDFPFAEQSCKANALALMLTIAVRQAIDGPVPLALPDAPRQGTGKTLLAEAVGIIGAGVADLMPFPSREEERQKLITSGLAEGSTLFIFDNLSNKIHSPALARALTAVTMADRILGHTKIIRLPQRATWIATANNVSLDGDLTRRCYWIRIDAQMARPWIRSEQDFKHPDLLVWIREHRGRLIWALLVLARAWFAAGCPKVKTPQMGKFERWCQVVGGILAHAGVEGFLGNLDAMYEELNEGDAEWEEFLTAWHARSGSAVFTVSEMVHAIFPEDGSSDADDLRSLVPADLLEGFEDGVDRKRRTAFARKLGIALRQKKDVRYGDDQIRLTPAPKDTHKKANAWRIVLGGRSAEVAEGVGRDPARDDGTDISASNLPPALPQLPHSRDSYDDEERRAIQEADGETIPEERP
jgi:hypothetical protein